MNSTIGPLTIPDAWSGYLAQAQEIASTRVLLLALVNIPLLAIVFNVLWQLVCH